MRRDAWWVQPLLVFLGLGAFVVYSTWAAFQGSALLFRALPFAVLFAGDFRRLAAQLVRAEAGLVAGLAAVFAGAADPLGAGVVPADLLLLPRRLLQSVLGRSAGLRRGRAAQDLSRRAIRSRSSCRTCIATSSTSRCSSSCFLAHDVWKAMWFIDPATGETALASASARSCSRSTSCCSAATRSAAIRCGIWSAAFSISLPNAPLCHKSLALRELPQPPPHALGMDESVFGRCSPTSTCGSARWASGATGDSDLRVRGIHFQA